MRDRDRPVIKTAEEIAYMRRSSRLSREIVARLGERVRPGITTSELDRLAHALGEAAGARPAFYQYGGNGVRPAFPGAICASRNEAVVHGIPDDVPLEEGDIISIDYGCVLDGWFGDTAYTWAVGDISDEACHLMDVSQAALEKGIEQAVPGKRVFDIARAVQNHCEGNGCGVVRSLVGHGIGRRLHEPPQVPNYAALESRRDRLRPGMTICIEPMVTAGTYHVHPLEDGWTEVTDDGRYAAHFEHTVVILSDGCEILSLPDVI